MFSIASKWTITARFTRRPSILLAGQQFKRSLNHTAYLTQSKTTLAKQRNAKNTLPNRWSVTAYNLSEELKIEFAEELLERLDEYQINELPTDLGKEAVMLSLKPETIHAQKSMSEPNRPLCDIFLFREGSIVFWGVPYEQQMRVLYNLSSLKVNPNASHFIQEEKEQLSYSLLSSLERSKLNRDTIQLSKDQDHASIQLDQFAFSHAVALSVKLGILEMMLEKYIESVDWITDNMKNGKSIKLTRSQVFRNTGQVLALKQSLNLDSDLLDLPDIYWDRQNQEDMFMSLTAYLNIKKRTNVMNEKLNNCNDLMNLLANHMNDRHHIRLEWMIIVLITVEVLFEVARLF